MKRKAYYWVPNYGWKYASFYVFPLDVDLEWFFGGYY